jgi:hypothetical protein
MLRLKMLFLISFSIFSLVNTAACASTNSVTRELVKWQTSGPGVSFPDAADPTRNLSIPLQRSFQCIRRFESRNHLQDGFRSQGWYQFTLPIWGFARLHIKGLPSTPNQATGDQQSAVAVFYYERNGRFGVEWAAEAGKCPGRFW